MSLGCGQAVRRLTLDQEIEGSNPSAPARSTTCSLNTARFVQNVRPTDRRRCAHRRVPGSITGVEDGSHRVLVVEDDPSLREIYAGALRGYGHDVRAAADGTAALNCLANGWVPCVVFLDLRMPGMDGWELSRRLRADTRWRDLSVVVVAAHFRIDQEAAQIGADGWLQKPFDLARLDQETRARCQT
jgi:CheY-like chemotaxis protein